MTITKKNGKYYCRFQINGERHHYLCNGATSVKEAKLIEDGFRYKLQQQQNGVVNREVKIYFKQLYKLYDVYASLNKKSYDKDLSFVKILKHYFPETDVASNKKPSDFEQFKIKILEDREVTTTTVNKYLNLLSKMYNLGIGENLLENNPLTKVKRFREKNYKIRYLTLEEEKRLYKSMSKLFPHLIPLVTTALQTGMRKGEIFNLKWSNIDFDFKFIELLETKSGKSRKIPISDKLMEVLNKQPKISDFVFVNKDTGKPYTDIKHSWKTVLEKANISNFRFHDLRHSVCTRLAENNIPLPVIQEIAGHSKITTTMRYTHVIPNQKVQAISVLNSYN